MWNRLLLLAYPKGPRRDEVLDTLTMAEEDGGRRPRAINLVRYGLRARLGRPRSRGIVALSLLLALVGGYLAASATNRLAWEAGPGLPAPHEAAALAELVAPGLGLDLDVYGGEAVGDAPFVTPPHEELMARQLHDQVPGTPETHRVGEFMTGLRQRLEAAGWRVTDQGSMNSIDPVLGREVGDRQRLSARTGDLVLGVGNNYHPEAGADFLIVFVYPAEPAWISALTVTGALLGAVLTWLLVAWASRHAEPGRQMSILAGAAAWTGLLLMTPSMRMARDYLPELFRGEYDHSYPFWVGLTWTNEYGFLAALSGLVFAAALALALLARLATPAPAPPTTA